jgi:hypothetical protein
MVGRLNLLWFLLECEPDTAARMAVYPTSVK